MSLICWNYWGLGNPQAIQFLKDMFIQKKPNIIFLCETFSNRDKVEFLRNLFGFDRCFVVEATSHSGGLAMFWKNVDSCSTHINLQVQLSSHSTFHLTSFYGEPSRSNRAKTWAHISQLTSSSTLPWRLFGDLNNTLSHSEKCGGTLYPNWLIHGFQEVLSRCNLIDLDHDGHPFTWEKSRGSKNWIEVCLDRALVSYSWQTLYPNAKLCNMGIYVSDHSPLHLNLAYLARYPHKHCFWFENAWSCEPYCGNLVMDQWTNNPSDSITNKLLSCRSILADWGRTITGKFLLKLNQSKSYLKHLKGKQDVIPVSQYEEIQLQFFGTLRKQELYWKQRVKQMWL